MGEKYLTKKQIMEKYNVSEATLYLMRKEGLPSKKANPTAKSPNAKLVYPEKQVEEWFDKTRKE